MAGRGQAEPGEAWQAWCGRQGKARMGTARLGFAGSAGSGTAGRGRARLGAVWPGKVRQAW